MSSGNIIAVEETEHHYIRAVLKIGIVEIRTVEQLASQITESREVRDNRYEIKALEKTGFIYIRAAERTEFIYIYRRSRKDRGC